MKTEEKNKNKYIRKNDIDFKQFILFIIVMSLFYIIYKKWNSKEYN